MVSYVSVERTASIFVVKGGRSKFLQSVWYLYVVHPFKETQYDITCIGNLIEERSCVS
jgi:hypothetical protein